MIKITIQEHKFWKLRKRQRKLRTIKMAGA